MEGDNSWEVEKVGESVQMGLGCCYSSRCRFLEETVISKPLLKKRRVCDSSLADHLYGAFIHLDWCIHNTQDTYEGL